VIFEDVRGRYASEGEWSPFTNESNDGYDSVEWAAALPYSTGKVGMFGGSYVGATQMLAAIAHPPHLAGICPATSNVFLAGHKLRLEISSSNFPRFDRNLNTGEDQAHSTRVVKAKNVIYHDSAHPSALIVPVVAGGGSD
jgi:predicted acyl esterase